MNIKSLLTEQQIKKIEEWEAIQDAKVAAMQDETKEKFPVRQAGEAYYGPSGGGLTYHLTPSKRRTGSY